MLIANVCTNCRAFHAKKTKHYEVLSIGKHPNSGPHFAVKQANPPLISQHCMLGGEAGIQLIGADYFSACREKNSPALKPQYLFTWTPDHKTAAKSEVK